MESSGKRLAIYAIIRLTTSFGEVLGTMAGVEQFHRKADYYYYYFQEVLQFTMIDKLGGCQIQFYCLGLSAPTSAAQAEKNEK